MLTPEDKQLIAKYMGWMCPIIDQTMPCIRLLKKNYKIVNFDLNDAALCVQEMQKRGEWQKFCATGFVIYFERERPSHVFPEDYIAWLFNAENFFNAVAEWLKEGK